MLNETASTREDRPIVRVPLPPVSQAEVLHNELRQLVATVMQVEEEAFIEPQQHEEELPAQPGFGLQSHLVATFEGRLLIDAETAYQQLDPQLDKLNYIAVFRPTPKPTTPALFTADIPHTIHILTGRLKPTPRPWWPNLLLFLLTLFSVLMVGTTMAISTIGETDPALARQLNDNFLLELWRGFPYAASLLLILGAHELGHYFAARRHNLAVTLPYFIPLPFLNLTIIGTMGAFIQLRQPMRNRKVLFDVGASGPLVGLIFAIPILFIGLSSAQLGQIIPGVPYLYEGDSLLYAFAKTLTFGRFVPDGAWDVMVTSSQLAWAGWTGLLVTALNLIPIGQLDGGHILYALIGEHARRLYYPILLAMGALALVSNMWLIWVLLLLFFGRIYATPLDMITPLDNRRRALAILSLVIFVLIFVPAPLTAQIVERAPIQNAPLNSAQWPLILPALAILLIRRLRP
ncbi:MAG: site-2 protease family protein [Anaerolineae bacterium]|nr:site-2 protease family protein [Anaerolineae bacterium]